MFLLCLNEVYVAKKERLKTPTKWSFPLKIVYLQILELCWEFKWQLTDLTGLKRARCTMNLHLLIMYCIGQSRTHQGICHSVYMLGKALRDDVIKTSLCFLLVGNYKTKYAYGPSKNWCDTLLFIHTTASSVRCKDVNEAKGCLLAFQQWCSYQKRSLVTPIRILLAKQFLLSLLACLKKGNFSGKMLQGRMICALLRDDTMMPQHWQHLQECPQHLVSTCSLSTSQPLGTALQAAEVGLTKTCTHHGTPIGAQHSEGLPKGTWHPETPSHLTAILSHVMWLRWTDVCLSALA